MPKSETGRVPLTNEMFRAKSSGAYSGWSPPIPIVEYVGKGTRGHLIIGRYGEAAEVQWDEDYNHWMEVE